MDKRQFLTLMSQGGAAMSVAAAPAMAQAQKRKPGTDDLGRNARTVIRHLDQLRAAGNLSQGVQLPQPGGDGVLAVIK